MKSEIKKRVVHAPHLYSSPSRPIGLGDAVKAVLNPITKTVDKVFGSKLSSCTPCSQRQAKLNELMPDITKPLS